MRRRLASVGDVPRCRYISGIGHFSVLRSTASPLSVVFANGRGFLTYWVPAGGDVVVLLRLVWAG